MLMKRITLVHNPTEGDEEHSKKELKKFDLGKVFNIKGTEFFLESFGYGIFPYLMKEMKNIESKDDKPEEALEKAMNLLLEIIDSYHSRGCELEIDGVDHSGTYLL